MPKEACVKTDIVKAIKKVADQEGVLMGVARAAALNTEAPHGFRPMDLMPDAKSVLVFAKPLPLSVFLTPESFKNTFYQRSAYMYYLLMDKLADTASMLIQDTGSLALPVPAYSPLRFHEGEPKGVISLKHAAAAAGLGKLGRSSLLINPHHGNIMRLGALLTELEWPEYSSESDFEPCPQGCHACERACPIGAINDGTVNKIACLGKCIKHVMLPPAFMLPTVKKMVAGSKVLTRFMELIALNFFETYGIDCTACLKACPHFPNPKKIATGGERKKGRSSPKIPMTSGTLF
jgi:epoxyqueuosine reductase